MFVDFFLHLRAVGLRPSLTEFLALVEAVSLGHARSSLSAFYDLGRACLVKKESQYDLWDRAFAEYFEGVSEQFDLTDELLEWLSNPTLPRDLTEEEKALLRTLDLDELRKNFLERLQEQKERHDGGSRWIGTGGTSPFGNSGTNPAGIRVGGSGGGRTAVQVATDRRFRNLRTDRILDTRAVGTALRRLRRLARDHGPEELDLPSTIDKTAREGGEIDLVFGPPRSNRVKLLLLMDVGGSMDPFIETCERLFSAAHAATHFRKFQAYYFHNCVYERLYTNMARREGPRTDDVLKSVDATWSLVLVGDAYMHPYELTQAGGAISLSENNAEPGIAWLRRLRERIPRSVWLNPEPRRIWDAASIRLVRSVFPMCELTIDGLTEAVDMIRGVRPNEAGAPPVTAPWARPL